MADNSKGFYVNEDKIGLYDAISDRRSNLWFPTNEETKRLHAILHACKQIIKLYDVLNPNDPTNDAHGLTLLSTPILTLVEQTLKLRSMTGRADSSFWPEVDRKQLRESGRTLDGFSKGKLRVLRRTSGAHADHESLASPDLPCPTADVLVPPLGNALIVALLLLNYEGVYVWTRTPGQRDTFEIMGQVHTAEGYHPPVAVEIGKAKDGTMTLDGLHYMEDPRQYAREVMLDCVDLYNALAAASTPRQQKLRVRHYEGPKANFRDLYTKK